MNQAVSTIVMLAFMFGFMVLLLKFIKNLFF